MTRAAAKIGTIIASSRLIVCCGSGGVGKTTASAALALRAAEDGRNVVVLTVDPARRLATCLGLDEIGWRPHPVAHDAPGKVWAMMLDTRAMFDDLVRRLAPDAEAADRIQQSRLYSVFAGTMHGTPEYMALESLYNVYHDARFDLVILDTPPLTNALEFFTVPERASWMFDERIMRWFVTGRRSRSVLGRFHPGAMVLKLLGTLAGQALVTSLVEFFTALDNIRDALKERGVIVGQILRDSETAYVVVTAPHVRRVDEALELDRQLKGLGHRTDAFVLNRSHAAFDPDLQPSSSDEQLVAGLNAIGGAADPIAAVAAVRRLYGQMAASGQRHREQIQRLSDAVGPDRIHTVPDFEHDIHDLAALSVLGRRMGD